ncbi:MAG: SMP-30/gluconolactonase/LRE family protein [Alphaproteobacteria bacterium]|nr:SMP-30/gluconolactonase/LRE family protein [Alphaproteobacteria bacterium]
MFFAPPERIATTVFARVPDALRKPRRSDWADANRGGAAVDCFLEGPSFDRDGNLWVTDIPNGRILRVSPAGAFTVIAEYDGEPNGLKIHRDGRIFLADYKNGIMLLDARTGRVEPLMPRRHSERFRGPNDLVFAGNGDLYFTDQGQTGLHDPTGRVYRLTAAGRLECLVDTVPSPNGIALSPDERTLYVAVTRANAVWRMPLMGDDWPSKVGTWIQLSGGTGPDGIAVMASGGIAICHVGLGAVWVFDALGEPLWRVDTCAGRATTNLAFGGPDRRTLFITESETGTILRATLPEAGLALYSHHA